jgi:hypothetical protein
MAYFPHSLIGYCISYVIRLAGTVVGLVLGLLAWYIGKSTLKIRDSDR